MNIWKPLPEPRRPDEQHIPYLISISFCVLVGIVIAITSALVMEPDAPDTVKIIRLLVMPAVVSALIFTVILLIHNTSRFWADMMQTSYIEMRNWWIHKASASIRLAGHTSLFPVENAALKMVRLEGEMPPQKDFPRKLSIGVDEDVGLSRTQQVLTRLLDQLDIATLNRPEIWLYMRNADEPTQKDATSVLNNHPSLQYKSKVHLLQALPQRAMLEEWIITRFCGTRLLIVMELHGANDDAFCEYATALLFAHDHASSDTRMPVWCFRSLSCQQYQVEKYLNILFAARQVVPANLRHVWTGNLQGEGWDLLTDALNEIPSGIQDNNWHSLPVAEIWTPGYQWLMLEWAARAIRHGQRGQLLATQESEKQQITMAMMCGELVTPSADDDEQGLQLLYGMLKVICFISLASLEALLLLFALPKEVWEDAMIYVLMFTGGMVLLAVGVITQGFNIARRHINMIMAYYHQ